MSKQLNISILCGGQSSEHEISIISARNAFRSLNRQPYAVSIIYITQQGAWYLLDKPAQMLNQEPRKLIEQQQAQALALNPGHPDHPWMIVDQPDKKVAVDCVFPVLHGRCGEDGTMQGLLDILDVPYVGCGTLGAAVCMEKHITKSLLSHAGIDTSPWCAFGENERNQYSYSVIQELLGDTIFVKPANAGSSVGISKVTQADQYEKALDEAFRYHTKVIIEKAIHGREIECSVIGNHQPIASLPGEVICHHDFYSYDAKYSDPNGADIITPATLDEEIVLKVQEVACRAYRTLDCRGMVRVDFFVEQNGRLWVNEVNPIPGMTPISLFIKNWEATGLSCAELFDDLIKFALEHYRELKNLAHVRITTQNDDSQSQSSQGTVN